VSALFLYNIPMKNVVVAFNYVEFQDPKKANRQAVAMEVMAEAPLWLFPISYGFYHSPKTPLRLPTRIPFLDLLYRDSRSEIGNNRDLPYIKEILNLASETAYDIIGYVNSDILLGEKFLETIQKEADAFIFSRSDIVETSPSKFLKGDFKVIYGGDQHIGADGFFFNRDWWINNRNLFPDDLIIGATEWDTVYRTVIKRSGANYIEKRVLYHVYHNQTWTTKSPEALNNIAIWEKVK